MKFKLVVVLSLLGTVSIHAQNKLDALVKAFLSGEPLMDVTAFLPSLDKRAIFGEKGNILIENVPNGTFQLRLSFIGYAILNRNLIFPRNDSLESIVFFFVQQTEEMEKVILVSTRSNRAI